MFGQMDQHWKWALDSTTGGTEEQERGKSLQPELRESKQKMRRRRKLLMLESSQGSSRTRMGLVSILLEQRAADGWRHPWAGDFGLHYNTRWDKHDPESDVRGETLSRLSTCHREVPKSEQRFPGFLLPSLSRGWRQQASWLLPSPNFTGGEHLPLSLSCSQVRSSGNQQVGVWYIFFKLYGKDCTLLILPDIPDSCQAGELS